MKEKKRGKVGLTQLDVSLEPKKGNRRNKKEQQKPSRQHTNN